MALRAVRDPSGRVRQTWQKAFAVSRTKTMDAAQADADFTLADEFDIQLPCNECTLSPSEVTMQWDMSVTVLVDTKQALAHADGYRCRLHEARIMDWVGFLQEGRFDTINEWRRDYDNAGNPVPNQCSAMVFHMQGHYTSAFSQPQQLRSTPQLRFTATVPSVAGDYGTQKRANQVLVAAVTGTVTISAVV